MGFVIMFRFIWDQILAEAARTAIVAGIISNYSFFPETLIRNIQIHEGNSPCFLSRNPCSNKGCKWYPLCNSDDRRSPLEE